MKISITFLSIAFLCCSFISIYPQLVPIIQDCKPQSPVTLLISGENVSETELKNKISSEKVAYSNADLTALKRQIDECNSNMEAELSAQKANIDALTLKYQQILAAKDVEKLQEHLNALEKSRKESLQTLDNNLAKCKRTGIFIAILKGIDPYGDVNNFIKTTQAAIIPIAIGDIIGENLKRVTTVSNLQTVKDVIVSYKGGKVQPGLELYKKPLYTNQQFIYVLKEEVYPTKEIPTSAFPRQNLPNNTLVFNALTEDYENEMRKVGIPDEEITQVKAKIDIHKNVIATENQNADTQQQNFANASITEVHKIEREIEDKKEELEMKKQQLRIIINGITGATYDDRDIVKSVKNAQNLLKSQLQKLQNEWFVIKAKELAFRETSVQIDGAPQEPLAQKAKELFTQIQKNYTEFTVSKELFVIEDGAVKEAAMDTKVQRYRKVKQIWLYPAPQNDGTFKLGVVTVFEMKEGSSYIQPTNNATNDSGGIDDSPKDFTEMVNGVSFVMKAIPAGTFMMGSNEGEENKKPAHFITLDAFYMGETEVTQALWIAVMYDNPANFSSCPNCPVESVSWNDVQEFIQKLNKLTKQKYRMPTEAEWEYAAKGGGNYKYAGSDNIHNVAWYDGNSGYKTHSVKEKNKNGYDLYDMSGNVWEWCSDWYDANYYGNSPSKKPQGPSSGVYRVLRGGSWYVNVNFTQLLNRYYYYPSVRSFHVGCRLVLSSL